MSVSPPKLATVTQLTRTPGSARLRRAICAAGLTQDQAGALVGRDGRQVRRWLKGSTELDLLCALEEIAARKVAA